MKSPAYLDTIHDAIYELTHHSGIPAKAQASDVGITYKKLTDSCLDSSPTNHHRTEWIIKQTLSARNPVLVDFIERKIGRVAVPVFEASALVDNNSDSLTGEVLAAASELGEMALAIQEGFSDGKLDYREAERCKKEAWDLAIQAVKVYKKIEQLQKKMI